ncbi:phage tail protein [Chitiniphilus purpureus]|uniref:Phage tail protein n=1 Tax=Chitiniphilus purpureus TaxID=2981137 RepID=A0ABY6DJY7_9NEIS|nr:phage tail protein [Chitiniphilus sp. CD1]UXY14680.1 phage tail protein [Chitiniphilus sp. CD1]
MMPEPQARFAIVTGTPAWLRCAFEHAALVDGVVQLAWQGDDTVGEPGPIVDPAGAGLAFGPGCRLYRSVPREGRIERLLWGDYDPLHPQRPVPVADVIAATPAPPAGDFAPAGAWLPAFTPRALACDDDGHLFVLDAAHDAVLIFDLPRRRLLRRVAVPAGAVDLAWSGGWLYGLSATPARLWRLSATRAVRLVEIALDALAAPARLAILADGRCVLLDAAHTMAAALWLLARRPGGWHPPRRLTLADGIAAHASDLLAQPGADGERLVLARRPNEDFLRLDLAALALSEPLSARGYDGMGIALAPDGRIAYWSEAGLRHAVAARPRYDAAGRVVLFRLDSGREQTVWGRVLLDACLPHGTQLRVHAHASDDEDPLPRLLRSAPAGSALQPIPLPEATPLPPVAWLAGLPSQGGTLFRRVDGTEQPWPGAPDVFATFEAPCGSAPGRYLWLALDLAGTSRATPRVRCVRAEHPGHDWLKRLPQLYSREPATRDFLYRYLLPLAGLSDELAHQSDQRHALLKPASAPEPVLPWLAGWLGLALDERLSETARRTLLAEAIPLLRLRGTPAGLTRLLEIATGLPVRLVERWRFRGLGQVGEAADGRRERAVVGFGLRVGARAGEQDGVADADAATQAFAAHAHRFAVMVLGSLTEEQQRLVRDLLEAHRPAHTLYELCTIDAGMRVGLALHLGLSSIIGRGAGFVPLAVGGPLGQGRTLGHADGALKPDVSRLDDGSRLR